MRKLRLILPVILLCIVCLGMNAYAASGRTYYNSIEELKGCDFANSDSNVGYEDTILKDIPGAKFHHYTNYADTFLEVSNGKRDAAFSFYGLFPGLKDNFPDLRCFKSKKTIPIVMGFADDAGKLKKQFNNYVEEASQDGRIDEMYDKWIEGYGTHADSVNFDELKGENGSFTFAINPVNAPYEYLSNNELAGMEPALVYDFCKEYGYKPDVVQPDYNAVVAGLSSGKYDMGAGGYGYTEERAEGLSFSEPYFYDHFAYVVAAEPSASGSFIGKLKEGFQRNFIREDRWKLLVNGLGVTLMITVMSVLLGSILGFLLFLSSRRSKRLDKLLFKTEETLEALPVLVILMVFFYIIFGNVNIPGVVAAVVVFGLLFTFTFYSMMAQSVKGVPREQSEAGLALGYNEKQVLFKILIPQALDSFLPAFHSAVVAVLKSTAIVGYVAVTDLTKAGDLIRSRTFDAFFPIIAIAICYYILARLLIFLLNRFVVVNKQKKSDKFLKEVE